MQFLSYLACFAQCIMYIEKSTGLVFGFFVALMLLDFDTLEKRDVLICNVTQLLFDFKHLKGIPSRIVAIQSDVTKICRLVPNDCQQDIEGFKKIINYLRLWLHQNPRYHSKAVKEEPDNWQGISKPFPRWQYWAPVKKQAADVCPARKVKFPNEKRMLKNNVIPKKMPGIFNPLGASKGGVISKGTFNLVPS